MTSHIGVSIAGPTSSFVLRYTLTQTHRSVHQSPSTDGQNTMKISRKIYIYRTSLASGGHLCGASLKHEIDSPFWCDNSNHKAVDYLCSPSYLPTLPPAHFVLLSTPRLMLTRLIPVWCFL